MSIDSYNEADSIRLGLSELLKAYRYAQEANRNRMQFAVEIGVLRALGLTDSDFRWLLCMGYAEHARERTRLDDAEREFKPTRCLLFTRKTCFVLSEKGVSFAEQYLRESVASHLRQTRASGSERSKYDDRTPKPHWDAERRELRINGKLVKQVKWMAMNQECILATLEEEGWPIRIDDPLPPQPEQDSKRRLSDTIKCLNRKQASPLIHFRGDGTGEGVLWEFVRPDSNSNGTE